MHGMKNLKAIYNCDFFF